MGNKAERMQQVIMGTLAVGVFIGTLMMLFEDKGKNGGKVSEQQMEEQFKRTMKKRLTSL